MNLRSQSKVPSAFIVLVFNYKHCHWTLQKRNHVFVFPTPSFFPFSPFHEAYVPCKHRGIEELPATFNASASQTTFVSTCQTSTHWHRGRRLIKMTSLCHKFFGYVAFLLAGASAKYFHGKAVFIFHSNLVFLLVLLSLSSLTVVERQLWCTWK